MLDLALYLIMNLNVIVDILVLHSIIPSKFDWLFYSTENVLRLIHHFTP